MNFLSIIPPKFLIYGIIILAVTSTILFLLYRNESLSSQNQQLTVQVSSLQEEIKYRTEMNDKITLSLNTLKKQKDKQTKQVTTMKEQIYKAEPAKNGEVAPVLLDTLMQLRNREMNK